MRRWHNERPLPMTVLGNTFVIPKSALDLWVLAGPTALPKASAMDERRDLVSQRAPGVIAEVDRVRAILAPTGKDLEALLISLHRQSAQSQRKARKSQQKVRDELYRRLEGQVVEVDSTGTVAVMPVTTRELIGMMEAESNLIKVESMSQRSYTVHRAVARAASPQGGSRVP